MNKRRDSKSNKKGRRVMVVERLVGFDAVQRNGKDTIYIVAVLNHIVLFHPALLNLRSYRRRFGTQQLVNVCCIFICIHLTVNINQKHKQVTIWPIVSIGLFFTKFNRNAQFFQGPLVGLGHRLLDRFLATDSLQSTLYRLKKHALLGQHSQ